MIRCAQWHTPGGGARPGDLPRIYDSPYISLGTSEEAGKMIARDGFSKSRRLRIHFYERDRNGVRRMLTYFDLGPK